MLTTRGALAGWAQWPSDSDDLGLDALGVRDWQTLLGQARYVERDPFADELFDLGSRLACYTEARQGRDVGAPARRASLDDDGPVGHRLSPSLARPA